MFFFVWQLLIGHSIKKTNFIFRISSHCQIKKIRLIGKHLNELFFHFRVLLYHDNEPQKEIVENCFNFLKKPFKIKKKSGHFNFVWKLIRETRHFSFDFHIFIYFFSNIKKQIEKNCFKNCQQLSQNWTDDFDTLLE